MKMKIAAIALGLFCFHANSHAKGGLWSEHSCIGTISPGNESIEFDVKVWDNNGGFERVPRYTDIIIKSRNGTPLVERLYYTSINLSREDAYHCKKYGHETQLKMANVDSRLQSSFDVENAKVIFDCGDEMGNVEVIANCKDI